MRFRLTAAVLGVLSVSMVAFSTFVYWATRHDLWQGFDAWLYRESQSLSHVVEEHANSRFVFEYQGIAAFEDRRRPAYFQFWKPDGTVMARSRWVVGGDLPRKSGDFGNPTYFWSTLPDGRRGRFMQVAFLPRGPTQSINIPPPNRQPTTIVVARGSEDVDESLGQLRLRLAGLGFLVVLGAGAAAAFMVGRELQPAVALASKIGGIDVQHLGERITVDRLPTELEPPVAKLNELLGRLDESFARERRFTSDVSHELRTPLAGLRAILEVTAARLRAPAAYQGAIDEAHVIVLQMQAMVENLLMLARLDGKQIEVLHEEVALFALVNDCWKLHAPKATERGLTFENQIPGAAIVETDRDKLRLILGNLLANAVAYTAPGGRVVVSGGAGNGVLLDVCDSGPPIPEPMMARIFERFFRAEAARSDAAAHCGIGLALVKGLCEVLALDVSAANLPDGSVRFRLAMVDADRKRAKPATPQPASRAAA